MAMVALATLTIWLPFAKRASAQPEGLLSHAPILIDGNAGFTPTNGVTSGSGTAAAPYVIEGWNIGASSADGIEVRNTSAHFIIRNCYVHDGRDNNKRGVYFETVKNWKIDNVTSTNNLQGIFVVYSSDGGIDNCTSENNLAKGIWLWYSDNNIVTNCTSRNNHFEDIHLWYSNNNKVMNCTIENDDHGITIDHSDNSVVTNCIFIGNNFGVYINAANSSDITNCTVDRNNTGIIIVSSYNNLIMGCAVENNNLGIKMSGSSSNNRIYHNNFLNNTSQALDNWTNYWDNGYPSGGNYWSNYSGTDNYRGQNQDIPGSDNIGDTSYSVPGGSNRDRYPFMSPTAKVPPEPPPEVPHERPWGLIIGILIVAMVTILVVVWRLLNSRRKSRSERFQTSSLSPIVTSSPSGPVLRFSCAWRKNPFHLLSPLTNSNAFRC